MLNRIREFNLRLFFRLYYLRKPPWDTGITPPELEEFIASHPPGRALDLGCGTGTNAIRLAKVGWQVAGVDFVRAAIRQARKKARRMGVDVDFLVGDVSDPSIFQGCYELIYDIGCYHVLDPDSRSRYRGLIAAHLAPGGTYLLYGFLGEGENRIPEADLEAFQTLLSLQRREEGMDRNERASAWFWFGPGTEQE